MSFISLPSGTIYKKRENRKLGTFPADYVGRFCRNLANNVDNSLGFDFHGQITNYYNIPPKDVQKYILVTSDLAKGMQN